MIVRGAAPANPAGGRSPIRITYRRPSADLPHRSHL